MTFMVNEFNVCVWMTQLVCLYLSLGFFFYVRMFRFFSPFFLFLLFGFFSPLFIHVWLAFPIFPLFFVLSFFLSLSPTFLFQAGYWSILVTVSLHRSCCVSIIFFRVFSSVFLFSLFFCKFLYFLLPQTTLNWPNFVSTFFLFPLFLSSFLCFSLSLLPSLRNLFSFSLSSLSFFTATLYLIFSFFLS